MTPAAAAQVAIRPVRGTDAPAVANIYALHVREGTGSFEVEPPDESAMAQRIAAIVEAGYPWLVADERDRVIAYAYAGPYRPRHGYRYTVEDSVYVAQDARGRGIGSALLARLLDICTTRGDRQMVAVIGDAANVASIAVHARAGFTTVGRLADVGRKFDRWLDVVLMQRALGDGAASVPAPRGTRR